MNKVQTRQLSNEERKELREQLYGMLIFLAAAILVFGFMFYLMPNDNTVQIVFGIFAMFFFGIIFWVCYRYAADLSSGEIACSTGVIEDTHTRFYRKMSGARRTIKVNGKKFYLNYSTFTTVQTGDTVEVYYAPKSGKVISLIVLNKLNTTPVAVKEKPAKTKSGILDEQDKSVLFHHFKQNNFFWFCSLLFTIWLIAGLIVGNLYMILVFLFPIPLLFIYAMFRIIKSWIKYVTILHSGVVKWVPSVIRNKTTTTVRIQSSYIIQTDDGKFAVGHNFYNKLIVGGKVELKLTGSKPVLLGARLHDGSYHPNK